MACKRSPVRLRHSPPNKIKASEQSEALLFFVGLHMVKTMGPGFAGAHMQKKFRNRVLNYNIVLGQT